MFKRLEKNDIEVISAKKIPLVLPGVGTDPFGNEEDLPFFTLSLLPSASSVDVPNPFMEISLGTHASSIWITGESGSGLYWNVGDSGDETAKPFGAVFNCGDLTSEVYKKYARFLLGNDNAIFRTSVLGGEEAEIKECLFVHFKRNFFKDAINRSPEGLLWGHSETTYSGSTEAEFFEGYATNYIGELIGRTNLINNPEYQMGVNKDKKGAKHSLLHGIYIAYGDSEGGVIPYKFEIPKKDVGLLYYDYGLAILRLNNTDYSQPYISGSVSKYYGGLLPSTVYPLANGFGEETWYHYLDKSYNRHSFLECATTGSSVESYQKLLFGFLQHPGAIFFFANINYKKSIIYCKLDSHEYNYSSNPTFVDKQGMIRTVIYETESDVLAVDKLDRSELIKYPSKTYITGIGFYNDDNQLLAVGKFSKPLPKSFDKKFIIKSIINY